jgi:A/G-specific adenine glycosylase
VWKHWKEKGRHDLPWRRPTLKLRSGKENFDSYRIMVSEVMLQQTQVSRVLPKYQAFIKKFPTVRHLARASLQEVLSLWSGLGYNRRAKYLHEAAQAIVREYRGMMPKIAGELEALPGIGSYTARAIMTFAHNQPSVFIETNIRTVFVHHFFPRKENVHDRELMPMIAAAAEGQPPREWYSALMDYGAYLKLEKGNASRRSAHYTRQKKFKGSTREARGLILKILSNGASSETRLVEKTQLESTRLSEALSQLSREGFVRRVRSNWMIV